MIPSAEKKLEQAEHLLIKAIKKLTEGYRFVPFNTLLGMRDAGRNRV